MEYLPQMLEGFQESEHRADWELKVWGTNLIGLFEQAGRGIAVLSGIQLDHSPKKNHSLHLVGIDHEQLLVLFLSELLFLHEQGWVAEDYQLAIKENTLDANLLIVPIAHIERNIKAVTYHDLHIVSDNNRLWVKIIFDV